MTPQNLKETLDLNLKTLGLQGIYLVWSLAETVNDVLLGLVAQDEVSRSRDPEVQHEQN